MYCTANQQNQHKIVLFRSLTSHWNSLLLFISSDLSLTLPCTDICCIFPLITYSLPFFYCTPSLLFPCISCFDLRIFMSIQPFGIFQSPYPSLAPSPLLSSPAALHLPKHSLLLLSTHPITLSAPIFTSSYPSQTIISLSLFSLLPFPPFPDSQSWLALSAVQRFMVRVCHSPDNPATMGTTHPNSGLKEIYRTITQWQLHWRFTTANSTGLNTPSNPPHGCFPFGVCTRFVQRWRMCMWEEIKCTKVCMHLNPSLCICVCARARIKQW